MQVFYQTTFQTWGMQTQPIFIQQPVVSIDQLLEQAFGCKAQDEMQKQAQLRMIALPQPRWQDDPTYNLRRKP
jgi:hypothetical protein